MAAAACFYGRRISELVEETPRCPTILHFGKTDASIPMERIDEIRERHPDLPIYLYDAGHGFFSDRRKDHQPDAARLARLRGDHGEPPEGVRLAGRVVEGVAELEAADHGGGRGRRDASKHGQQQQPCRSDPGSH